MSEVTRHDVTEEIKDFYDRFSQDDQAEEVAAYVPGLYVVARNGLLKASTVVHDFDGCHPYEWTRTEADEELTVTSLSAHQSRFGGGIGEIRTNKLPLYVNPKFLESVRFEQEEQPAANESPTEAELANRLSRGGEIINAEASDLVGYDEQLLVSAASPLNVPVTLPKTSQYGQVEPLQKTPVGHLSVIGQGDERQVLLDINYRWRGSFKLPPLALKDVRFSIEKLERSGEHLAWWIKQLHREGKADEVAQLADEFNNLEGGTDCGFRPQINRDSRDDFSYVLEADYSGGQLGQPRFGKYEPLYDRQRLAANRIVLHPDTGQPFVVDEAKGLAMSLDFVEIGQAKYMF